MTEDHKTLIKRVEADVADWWYEPRPNFGDDIRALLTVAQAAQGLMETLKWYAEQAEGCRKIGSIGEPFQRALDRDGGKRAYTVLAAYTAATQSTEPDSPVAFGVACHANRDGDCTWAGCPQKRDREPDTSGRSCPLPNYDEEDQPTKGEAS